MSIFLNNIKVHPSWKAFFNQEKVIKALKEIEAKISGKAFTPSANNVLRFVTLDVKALTVAIFGKDPYAQMRDNGELVATGRAFEVSHISSWNNKEINSSLKNILKSMHKTYFKRSHSASIDEVRESIADGSFPILPPNEAFTHWENQGVLFLNTAFTCEVGGIKQAGSHKSIWRKFFKYLLEYLAVENPKMRYFLWGEAKKSAKQLIKLGVSEDLLYLSKHPCTNGDVGGYMRDSAFLNNPCFYETSLCSEPSQTVTWV